jgi:hypothetical protein
VLWELETIPDPSSLFYRVHRNYVRNGLGPHIFSSRSGAMSVDWCRYSSAEESRLRAKTPSDNGVVALKCHEVRSSTSATPLLTLLVEHSPIQANNTGNLPPNRSHTDVKAINCLIEETTVRYKLWNACGRQWKISVDEPVCQNPPAGCS